MRIAILDDDPHQLEQLVKILSAPLDGGEADVSCVLFPRGELLRRALRRETFDLLILDWNVPDLDGLDLLRWIRTERHDATPVLMLSSRGSERDVSGALLWGADDYVIKPFRPLELRARLTRLYGRRPQALQNESMSFGNWHFRRGLRMVHYEVPSNAATQEHQSEDVQLTDREFRLALALFRNIGRAVSRGYLVDKAGYDFKNAASRSLDSHIYRLRLKLKLDGQRDLSLVTVYGKGYQLEPSR